MPQPLSSEGGENAGGAHGGDEGAQGRVDDGGVDGGGGDRRQECLNNYAHFLPSRRGAKRFTRESLTWINTKIFS